MGITERREREKEEIRNKILDAARDLFAREGYEAVTMRRIAEAIEYSPTTIYIHFEDKDDLVLALCHEDFARLLGALAQLPFFPPANEGPHLRLRLLLRPRNRRGRKGHEQGSRADHDALLQRIDETALGMLPGRGAEGGGIRNLPINGCTEPTP